MKRFLALACTLMFALCAFTGNTLAVAASVDTSLPPETLPQKDGAPNPYMAKSEANIHNDCFNSDVTDAVISLGIYMQLVRRKQSRAGRTGQ